MKTMKDYRLMKLAGSLSPALTFLADYYFAAGAVLHVTGWLAASLASTQWISIAFKKTQMSLPYPWGTFEYGQRVYLLRAVQVIPAEHQGLEDKG